MAGIYGLSCILSAGGNTGTGKCSITMKHVVGNILIPKGKAYKASDFATLIAKLKTDAAADNKYNRVYPILVGWEEVALANQERGTKQFGYGRTVTTKEEMVGRTYTIYQNECLNRSIVQFRDKQDLFDLLSVTADGAIIGTEKTDPATGEVLLGGFALDTLYPSSFTEPTVADAGMWTITFVMKFVEEWDRRLIVKPEDGNVLTDLNGLQNVVLNNVPQTPIVAGEYHILATTSCGGTNLSEIYGTELAVVGNWVVKNFVTGGPISVTSVAVTPAGNFKLILDTADTDFVAGQKISISLAAPSVLAAADVEGYESNTVIVPNA